MTDKTNTTWQPTLCWPSRKHWESMHTCDGVGAGVSYRLADYATPQETADILTALRPVRGTVEPPRQPGGAAGHLSVHRDDQRRLFEPTG
jgi:hypothetical protein